MVTKRGDFRGVGKESMRVWAEDFERKGREGKDKFREGVRGNADPYGTTTRRAKGEKFCAGGP